MLARIEESMTDQGTRHGVASIRHAIAVAAVALVYFGAAKLGLSLAFTTRQVTAVWPATGIALAAVLLLGYRIWPGIFLGAFIANATQGEPSWTAAGIGVGNTLG